MRTLFGGKVMAELDKLTGDPGDPKDENDASIPKSL